MPVGCFIVRRIAIRSGIIRPAAGTATRGCASTICCCRRTPRIGLQPARSTRNRAPRSAPRTTHRSGASWQFSLVPPSLRRGGERVLALSERRERDDDQCTVARPELCEIVGNRKVALPRHGEQDRVLRRNQRAILGDADLAHHKLLTGKRNGPARTAETRQADKSGAAR